jgi:hypothetical protein
MIILYRGSKASYQGQEADIFARTEDKPGKTKG